MRKKAPTKSNALTSSMKGFLFGFGGLRIKMKPRMVQMPAGGTLNQKIQR